MCYYCDEKGEVFSDMISHLTVSHSNEHLSYKKNILGHMYQNKYLKHLPKPKAFLDNVKLKINDENETIKLIRENEKHLKVM